MPQSIHSQTNFEPVRIEEARIWMLVSGKNTAPTQMMALTAELDAKPRQFLLSYEPWQRILSFFGTATRMGLSRSVRYSLVPPWPDMLIFDAPEAEPAARWIQAQAATMGRRTRLVRIGRPWAKFAHFDLVVTTPQQPAPPAPNVRLNRLPLHRLTAPLLEAAHKSHSAAFRSLPKPHHVLLLGDEGASNPLGEDELRVLVQTANSMTQDAGGTLCIAAGVATPHAMRQIIDAETNIKRVVHYWQPDAADDDLYFGFLAHGDAFILVGDNTAMLAEALYTDKPVYIYHRGKLLSEDTGFAQLIAEGRIVWLGESFKPHELKPIDDLSQTADAVRRLFL